VQYTEIALSIQPEIMDNAAMSREATLAELIDRSRDGDADAMEQIYYRYKTALFNLAYRHTYDRATAEDLLQDIFIKVFTHLDNVKTATTFTGWVYRIALNTCYSHLRGRRIEKEKSVPLDDVAGVLHEGGAEEAAGDVRKPLDEAVGLLPQRLREVFILHDVQGFKHEEIARMLRLSVGTSKSQLFKARLRIRGFLKDRGVC
jgi:RNA polymerase sigma-70 factor (ECF subfamily)